MASRDPDRARAHRPLRRLAQQATTVRQRRESLHLFFRSSMKQAGDFFFFFFVPDRGRSSGLETRQSPDGPWPRRGLGGQRGADGCPAPREERGKGRWARSSPHAVPRGQGGLARESKPHTQKVIGRGAKPAPSRCPKKAMPKEEGGRGEAAACTPCRWLRAGPLPP